MIRGQVVAAVMPALNEEGVIGGTLRGLPDRVDVVWVADNGSTDGTAAEARATGARVVHESRRGYGAACQAAIRSMAESGSPPAIVVFLDADGSQDPAELDRVVGPIAEGAADLVIGVRRPDALPPHVAVGNRLACLILHLLTGHRFSDLGPFRAVSYDALQRLRLRDLDWGWNVEMQARAVGVALRIREVPVAHRPRRGGSSKISGSLRGTLAAGSKILWTAVRLGLAVRFGWIRPSG